MSEPSTLSLVKNIIRRMPKGEIINYHDLCKALPDEKQETISSAISALKTSGVLEEQTGRIHSSYVRKDGKLVSSIINSYVIRRYPETADNSKPTPYERPSRSEPAPAPAPVSTKKFDRIFAGTYTERLPLDSIKRHGDEVVFICDNYFRSDIPENLRKSRIEWPMAQRLRDFNNKRDAILFFGDTMVTAMAVFYLAQKFRTLYVGRWSTHDQDYKIHEINVDDFKI